MWFLLLLRDNSQVSHPVIQFHGKWIAFVDRSQQTVSITQNSTQSQDTLQYCNSINSYYGVTFHSLPGIFEVRFHGPSKICGLPPLFFFNRIFSNLTQTNFRFFQFLMKTVALWSMNKSRTLWKDTNCTLNKEKVKELTAIYWNLFNANKNLYFTRQLHPKLKGTLFSMYTQLWHLTRFRKQFYLGRSFFLFGWIMIEEQWNKWTILSLL